MLPRGKRLVILPPRPAGVEELYPNRRKGPNMTPEEYDWLWQTVMVYGVLCAVAWIIVSDVVWTIQAMRNPAIWQSVMRPDDDLGKP